PQRIPARSGPKNNPAENSQTGLHHIPDRRWIYSPKALQMLTVLLRTRQETAQIPPRLSVLGLIVLQELLQPYVTWDYHCFIPKTGSWVTLSSLMATSRYSPAGPFSKSMVEARL